MHPVDIQPLLDSWFYPSLVLILAGLSGWVLLRSQTWLSAHAKFLDASAQQKIADLESRALKMGTDALIEWVETTGNKIHPVADSGVTAWAANLAMSHAGGILTKNGLSPEEVAAKLLARLPDNAVATDSTGAKDPIIPVQSQPLQPIGKTS